MSFPVVRRASLLAIPALVLGLSACGDDDDNGGTGPSANCIDEIDYTEAFFTDDDVQTINVGQNRSGTISTSDPSFELEGFGSFYYDIYALAVEEGGVVTITVDPAGEFDADVVLTTTNGSEIAYEDDFENSAATEVIEENLNAGCYVIGVSSPFVDETGSYTISVD